MSESKTVCIISENAEVKDICERLAARANHEHEQIVAIFMKAKEEADAIALRGREESKEGWDILRRTLTHQLYLKGYDETKHHITFNLKDDIIKIVDNKPCASHSDDKQS